MNTRLTVTVSAYNQNNDHLFTKLILIDKDISKAPPIEDFVDSLQKELLPDFKKENSSIAAVIVDGIVIIEIVSSTDTVAHTVWPKPSKNGA